MVSNIKIYLYAGMLVFTSITTLLSLILLLSTAKACTKASK